MFFLTKQRMNHIHHYSREICLGRHTSSADETADGKLLSGHAVLDGGLYMTSKLTLSNSEIPKFNKTHSKTYSGALGNHGVLLSAHHLNMSGVSLVGYPLFQLLPFQSIPFQSINLRPIRP